MLPFLQRISNVYLMQLDFWGKIAMHRSMVIIAAADARYACWHGASSVEFIDPVVAFAPYMIHCHVVVKTQRATRYQILLRMPKSIRINNLLETLVFECNFMMSFTNIFRVGGISWKGPTLVEFRKPIGKHLKKWTIWLPKNWSGISCSYSNRELDWCTNLMIPAWVIGANTNISCSKERKA